MSTMRLIALCFYLFMAFPAEKLRAGNDESASADDDEMRLREQLGLNKAITADDVDRLVEQSAINAVILYVSKYPVEKQAAALVACIEACRIHVGVTSYRELERCFSFLEHWSLHKTETDIVASIDSPLVANEDDHATLLGNGARLWFSPRVVITFKFDDETKVLLEWHVTVRQIKNVNEE